MRWSGILLLRSTLFTLKGCTRIILAYKMMCTTHTSLDLAKPSYNFIIYLKLAKKEVVRSPTTSFYFVLPQKVHSYYLSHTKRCVQLMFL